MQKFIKEFNKEDSLLVISSYPYHDGEGAKQNAVACYSQNLLSGYKDKRVIVLADKNGHPHDIEKKGNILIVRTWKPAKLGLFIRLAKQIIKFNRVRDILIQFEFNMFGSVLLTAFLPFFVIFLKLLGKTVTVVQHQVVCDLSSLSVHLNVNRFSIKNSFLNLGLKAFYKLLGTFTDSIIVHEEALKQRLTSLIPSDKIQVISHGLSIEKNSYSYASSRKDLGIRNDEKAILIFGYITWYKGTDWIIEKIGKMAESGKKIKLLIVGGPSATLQSKVHYRRYLDKVYQLENKYRKFILNAGYVSDSEVGKYFAASDLVVLPYRTFMSASGPLSFALRFKKPFMISKQLASVLENSDFANSLVASDVEPKQITFSLDGKDFDRKIAKVFRSQKVNKKIVDLVSNLRVLRSWENIVEKYSRVIDSKASVVTPHLALGQEVVQ